MNIQEIFLIYFCFLYRYMKKAKKGNNIRLVTRRRAVAARRRIAVFLFFPCGCTKKEKRRGLAERDSPVF